MNIYRDIVSILNFMSTGIVTIHDIHKAKSRKYHGMFKVHSPKNNDKFEKGLVSTSRSYARPKWDSTTVLYN